MSNISQESIHIFERTSWASPGRVELRQMMDAGAGREIPAWPGWQSTFVFSFRLMRAGRQASRPAQPRPGRMGRPARPSMGQLEAKQNFC